MALYISSSKFCPASKPTAAASDDIGWLFPSYTKTIKARNYIL